MIQTLILAEKLNSVMVALLNLKKGNFLFFHVQPNCYIVVMLLRKVLNIYVVYLKASILDANQHKGLVVFMINGPWQETS